MSYETEFSIKFEQMENLRDRYNLGLLSMEDYIQGVSDLFQREDKIYTLFWLTGRSEVVKGRSLADAFTLAGYGAGALGALSFHAHGDRVNDFAWDSTERKWKNITNE